MIEAIRKRAARASPLLAAGWLACAAPPPAPVVDGVFSSGRRTMEVDALVAWVELGPQEDFRISEVARDAHTSHHVVAIRHREIPHRHDRHDLWVVLLRGHGSMELGGDVRRVGPGSILYVPRGMPHAFRNAAPEPAVAYAVYAPAFDGRDRVTVE